MTTKKQLKAENAKLKAEISTINVLLRAYIQANHKLQDDIDLLNASLNVTADAKERWEGLARKADERRKELARTMGTAD